MHKQSIKTAEEINLMKEGGRLLAQIRDQLSAGVQPGVSGLEIEKLALDLISQLGGKPSFKTVRGYHWATCINVNDVVVHGIPSRYKFKDNDTVGIDVGLVYRGFHTDTSVTVKVGKPKNDKFLDTGRTAVKRAIALAKPGRRVIDLSRAMQETVEEAGFNVVRALTGHGIGKNLHEEPAIPCFVVGKYENSQRLLPGMTLAIEVMYNQGTSDVVYKNTDGWTIATADGKISGLFEETVVVTNSKPLILTQSI